MKQIDKVLEQDWSAQQKVAWILLWLQGQISDGKIALSKLIPDVIEDNPEISNDILDVMKDGFENKLIDLFTKYADKEEEITVT